MSWCRAFISCLGSRPLLCHAFVLCLCAITRACMPRVMCICVLSLCVIVSSCRVSCHVLPCHLGVVSLHPKFVLCLCVSCCIFAPSCLCRLLVKCYIMPCVTSRAFLAPCELSRFCPEPRLALEIGRNRTHTCIRFVDPHHCHQGQLDIESRDFGAWSGHRQPRFHRFFHVHFPTLA